MASPFQSVHEPEEVTVEAGGVLLGGSLTVPDDAQGIVLFAHGSGSSRHSPRNQLVAGRLQEAGLGTLLMDLLSPSEADVDARTRHLRFDIDFLAGRLIGAVDWLGRSPRTATLGMGLFGASTGAAAALVAAAQRPNQVGAVVSRGGRPDLAGDSLPRVQAPTLLIVGGDDEPVLELNEQALRRLAAPVKELTVIPGAGHLFEGPGELEEVARLAAAWFGRHLSKSPAA